MRITVINRGGLSVYGGSYDPRRNAAVTDKTTQQTVTVEFPQAITAATLTGDGLTVGSVTVEANKATFTISGCGSADLIATMGDERPAVRIITPRDQSTDYGG
ncbi:hypothetical protein [Brevundimonas diminuta]|uniref:hypothetical protein n=1 Tax=Brevundimonas diminuta TaxID=293 RepID=UPI0025A5AFA0|nr:hypothetical protein [Brevundimonas diminuta]MDM8352889.1 hypothetical protein [Brevundimonas diminuta]